MRSWIDPGCDPSRRASRRNASRRSASRRSGARFATPAAAPNVASGGCRNCWKLKLRHAQRSINDAMQEVHWRRPMSSHLSRIAATSAERMPRLLAALERLPKPLPTPPAPARYGPSESPKVPPPAIASQEPNPAAPVFSNGCDDRVLIHMYMAMTRWG